jgi:glycine/D-amino acid oxidase-like deaminating enzyme
LLQSKLTIEVGELGKQILASAAGHTSPPIHHFNQLRVNSQVLFAAHLVPARVKVLELLSCAYALTPGLAEARIRELTTQVRPARSDNLPAHRYEREEGVLRINGLYRHGFLLSPVVIEQAFSILSIVRNELPRQELPLCMFS